MLCNRELVNQRLCLTHPYIITLHEVFLTPEHLCIAMEYADGGDLTQFVCNYVTHLVRAAVTISLNSACPALWFGSNALPLQLIHRDHSWSTVMNPHCAGQPLHSVCCYALPKPRLGGRCCDR